MTTLVRAPSREVRSRIFDSARWAGYQPREDDVVIATYPKCGTTWTQMICALLVHGPTLPRPLTRLSPWLDRLSAPIHAVIDDLERQGIAYTPFFPLGGFTPLQSSVLDSVAASLKATPLQVALAWLLRRSPNVLLIPGTSSVEHLRENVQAAALQLPSEVITELDLIAAKPSV